MNAPISIIPNTTPDAGFSSLRSPSIVLAAKQKIEQSQVEGETLRANLQNEKEMKARALIKRLENRRKMNISIPTTTAPDIVLAEVEKDILPIVVEGVDEPIAIKKSGKKKMVTKSKDIRAAERISEPIDKEVTDSIAKLRVEDDIGDINEKEPEKKKKKKKKILKKKIKVKISD